MSTLAERQAVMEELVHDEASHQASKAINEGEERTYLLAHGWTNDAIDDAIEERLA